MIPNEPNTEIIQVRRTTENTRKRPYAGNRHDHPNTGLQDSNGQSFIYKTDLEWMSLNYRKERAAKMSKSIRRMILIMFQDDYQYFPTLREIRNELIMA